MSCYISNEMCQLALSEMRVFYTELLDLYKRFGIDIEMDTGRRNMLMSSLQEKTFAAQIKSIYPSTFSDGKTGEPDIVIPEIDSELECKLTSQHRSGSWSLQTDYNTLRNKGSLDYLYVLASADFQEFAVLFFEGLTCDDFHFPAPGSKGKSRMKLSTAMQKCIILHGDVQDKKHKYIEDANQIIKSNKSSPSQLRKAQSRLLYWKRNSRISFSLEALNV